LSVLAAIETNSRMILLTGRPGSGKTTVVSRVVLLLRTDGLSVGGVYSKERRSHGTRVGFEMVDLGTDGHETLASTTATGPRMGRYRVNLKGLGEFAAPAVVRATWESDVVVCDEVGPMELISPEFRRAIEGLMSTKKPCLIVVHAEMADPLLVRLKKSAEAQLLEVTDETRNSLPEIVYAKLKAWMRRNKGS
jgi:nucleoside-triphosphatase